MVCIGCVLHHPLIIEDWVDQIDRRGAVNSSKVDLLIESGHDIINLSENGGVESGRVLIVCVA